MRGIRTESILIPHRSRSANSSFTTIIKNIVSKRKEKIYLFLNLKIISGKTLLNGARSKKLHVAVSYCGAATGNGRKFRRFDRSTLYQGCAARLVGSVRKTSGGLGQASDRCARSGSPTISGSVEYSRVDSDEPPNYLIPKFHIKQIFASINKYMRVGSRVAARGTLSELIRLSPTEPEIVGPPDCAHVSDVRRARPSPPELVITRTGTSLIYTSTRSYLNSNRFIIKINIFFK